MQWFGKNERKEIWDEAIQWPIGDIEAAKKIRDICRAAADSDIPANRTTRFRGICADRHKLGWTRYLMHRSAER